MSERTWDRDSVVELRRMWRSGMTPKEISSVLTPYRSIAQIVKQAQYLSLFRLLEFRDIPAEYSPPAPEPDADVSPNRFKNRAGDQRWGRFVQARQMP